MHYKEVQSSILLFIGTLTTASLFFAERNNIENNFFRIGPCTNNDSCAKFFGITIDTWGTWSILMLAITLKEGAISFAYTSYRPWFSNVVMDHKTTNVNHSLPIILLMLLNYKLFSLIDSVIDVTLVITMEIQYIFCKFLVETLIYTWNTIHAVKNKISYVEDQEMIEF